METTLREGIRVMGHVAAEKRHEIDRNLEFFLRQLPSLLPEHEGQCALMRQGTILGFFPTAMDAQIAGNQQFSDGVFSIQIVQDEPEELGLYCDALHKG